MRSVSPGRRRASFLALLASLPWLAWRYDNESGAFFPLSLLFLLVPAVPALLLVLMAVTH